MNFMSKVESLSLIKILSYYWGIWKDDQQNENKNVNKFYIASP